MKNVTISLPEEVLEQLRLQANAANQSLNAWLRDLLTKEAGEKKNQFCDLLDTIDRIAAPCEPWTWSREETYEERLNRFRPGE